MAQKTVASKFPSGKFLEFKTFERDKPLFLKKETIQGVYLTDYHDYNRPANTRGNSLNPVTPRITPNVICLHSSQGNFHIKGTLDAFWKIYNGTTAKRSNKTKKSVSKTR